MVIIKWKNWRYFPCFKSSVATLFSYLFIHINIRQGSFVVSIETFADAEINETLSGRQSRRGVNVFRRFGI
jgi:hypothetical protein